ncbi:MAG: ATP-binding protein [Candidatus Puniceispirillaceae bacterium]
MGPITPEAHAKYDEGDLQVMQLEGFSNLIEDGLLLVNHEQIIIYANGSASKMLGEELVNRSLSSVIHNIGFDDIFDNLQKRQKADEFLYTHTKPVMRQFRIKLMGMGESYIGVLIMDMTLQRNLDKVRRDFVANVSHELRSPLTSLVGFIETLQNTDNLTIDEKTHFLSIMEEESKRMTRLIDDLISLSRVEVEEHILPNEEVRLDEVIGSVSAILQDRASKQAMNITIDNAMTDGRALIKGETDEMVEVFHNLIENAVKYGYPDSVIAISLREEQTGFVTCEVENQGDGIEQRHIPRLTERFYRVDKARSRQKGGTGLGLAIVKHIVNRHRGDMKIKSVIGEKTSFTITLPLIRPKAK